MSCRCKYPDGKGFEPGNEVFWNLGGQTERFGELITKPFTNDGAISDVWLVKPYDNDELVFVRESDMEAYYWA